MGLFNAQINNWKDWEKIFQSIPTFTPLIEYIFEKESLPIGQIENLTPGTNAVFKASDYVVKIFAPPESGMEVGTDFNTELFGIRRAEALGIPAPKLIASGEVKDRYNFSYMIMEYLDGKAFRDIRKSLSYEEKIVFGQKLRKITDKLNTRCENFDPVDVIWNAINNNSWSDYPPSFNKERLSYLAGLHIDKGDKVYCHGDLNADNIFVDDNFELRIIDFADGMSAPAEYEEALIVCELFCFEKPYMIGYYGDYTVEGITELCAAWLPVHDFGGDIVRDRIGPASLITSLDIMKERLFDMIKTEKERTNE